LTFGTWTCTVTDANACTTTRTFSITQPSALVASALSQTNISCNGGSNGAASITVSGGTTSYSYNWTPGNPTGDGTASVTGLTFGTWTCTVTDANSCVTTQTFNITQPTALVASALSQTNVSCNSGSNGAASVSVTGGTTSYSYNWTPGNPTGDGTASVTGLTFGTWTCTVTDANSCVTTQSFNITQPTALVASALSQTNISCNGGSNGAASITASGGTTYYSYNWTPGNPTGDGTASVTGLTFGNWTCTVTDANSCVTTQTFNITQPTALVASALSQTNVSCNSGSNGAASVSVTGGTTSYSYNWTPGNPTGDGTASVTGLTFGTWTCTVTDANSCVTTQSFNITEPSLLTSTSSQVNVTCNGGNNGSITVNPSGGTAGYTYAWLPIGGNAATANNLIAGIYNCTITDANGCFITPSITVTEPSAITANSTQTNVSCNGGNNGSATIFASGGTGLLSYAWSSGGTNATENNIGAGLYTCTITDANSCFITTSITITAPTAITSSVSILNNVSCYQLLDGSATITASGGTGTLSYSWSPSGGNAASATGLGAGTYVVTINDTHSCTITQSLSITQPIQVVVNANASATTVCYGTLVSLNGTGTATTYNWSGGVTDNVAFVATTTTTYTVTGINGSGCQNTNMITINVNALPTVNAIASATTVCAGSMVTLTGGGNSTSYSWSGGVIDGVGFINNTTANYTVTGTDANGCSADANITVNVNPVPIVDLGADQALCSGTVSLDAQNVGSSYSWNDNSTSQTLIAATTGIYWVDVTNANGCSTRDSVAITINTNPVVFLGNDTVLCGGSITLDAGNAGAIYLWSDNSTNQTLNVTTSGVYLVMATLTGGCFAIDTIIVTINSLPNVVFSIIPDSICMNDAAILLSATPIGGSFSGTGVTGSFFNPSTLNGTETITYTFTDSNTGCTSSSSDTIVVDACTGIVDQNGNSNILNVYPNPNTGLFTIDLGYIPNSEVRVDIMNSMGQKVQSFLMKDSAQQVDLGVYETGIYLLRIIDGNNVNVKRVVKE
ncbi:MAG: T9SS type A sorting domain-containing protein, partial [Bacteroidetes bacterium]|nr:T9SS type A sorting domain-containing protein [Bacteroidota bacterium]